MGFLPYGFGVRFTRDKGILITNDDVEVKPKSPPSITDLSKVREDYLRRRLSTPNTKVKEGLDKK